MLSINGPSTVWKTRRISWLVKSLIDGTGISLDDLARYYSTTKNYLNTKFSRNSFSFDDILIVVYMAGKQVQFYDPKTKTVEVIDVESWFRDSDPEVAARLGIIMKEKEDLKKAHDLYSKKKAELEKMKAQYGFMD